MAVVRNVAVLDRKGRIVISVVGSTLEHLATRNRRRVAECGPCRACWKPGLQNISYPRTTERGVKGTGKRSPQLRIFQ